MDWNRYSPLGTRLGAGLMILLSLLLFEAKAGPPRFKRVVIVVLENTDFSKAVSQPFLTDLANRGALFTQLAATTHPSQPNYIALVAGSTLGVLSNASVDLNAQHIGDLLEASGRGWKVYAEDYPGNCFTGGFSKGYVRKHNPFISFTNVHTSPQRCARIVNTAEFEKDVHSGSLPEYSLYVPNLKNDGHDTGVGFADKWLATKFSNLLNDPAFTTDTLFVVTFDENAGGTPNIVYTVFYGPMVRPGVVSSRSYTHFGLLRTIEDELGLGTLGRQDQTATAITDVWR